MFLGGFLFTLLVPIETGMNTLQKSYKIFRFTLYPHYHAKTKSKTT